MKPVACFLLMAAIGLSAQTLQPGSLFEKPFPRQTLVKTPAEQLQSAGWLDPSRFNMSHSYSMSYMNSGGQGDLLGLYLNHMQYQFAIPLTLQVDWGYAMRPLEFNSSNPNAKAGNLVLPRVALQYQPTKNLFISFEYMDLSGLRSREFNQRMMPPFFLEPVPVK